MRKPKQFAEIEIIIDWAAALVSAWEKEAAPKGAGKPTKSMVLSLARYLRTAVGDKLRDHIYRDADLIRLHEAGVRRNERSICYEIVCNILDEHQLNDFKPAFDVHFNSHRRATEKEY